jgi:hypothetical protein
MLRRGAALGGALIVLILLVLGVRGCLDARADRALRDYAGDVTQIADETAQTSKSFFDKMSDPGALSVTELVAEVNADRSAMDNYRARVDGLDAPGDMSDAQTALELVYELRSSAMTVIANRMSTALGDAGAEKATEAIARQMRKLVAADVLYETVVRPEINGVLDEHDLGDEVPRSVFVPDENRWLDEGEVSSALGSVSGASGAATPGVHGLGLISTAVNGIELSPEVPATVSAAETPEVEVEVQNQGESTENGVTVTVTVTGGASVQQDISEIAAGETATAAIPLTPAPKGEAMLEVVAEPVPGEQVSENNEATYTVTFE